MMEEYTQSPHANFESSLKYTDIKILERVYIIYLLFRLHL